MSTWSEDQKRTLIAAHKAGKTGWCPECNRAVEATVSPSPKGGAHESVTLTCVHCGRPEAAYER